MSYKFRGHETFFIRKGWLNKGMKYVFQDPSVFVRKDCNPMDVLGIGSNMVKSLRYWLQAVGLTAEPKSGKRDQHFTDLGNLIYENDRYIEELGTLHLLQYKLATNRDEATAWYYFFNHFMMTEFSKDEYISALAAYEKLELGGEGTSIRSYTDDFNCIISTYVPRYKTAPGKVSPENNIDCPLGEIGLIDILNKEQKIYKKTSVASNTINPWVALAIIVDNSYGNKEIKIQSILNDECNLGKVFNLDSIALLDVLRKIEDLGEIKIVRTSGMDIITIVNNYEFINCVSNYYLSISERA